MIPFYAMEELIPLLVTVRSFLSRGTVPHIKSLERNIWGEAFGMKEIAPRLNYLKKKMMRKASCPIARY